MRAVLQRCDSASVSAGGVRVSGFDGEGLLALVGVTHDDTPDDAAWLARKIAELRVLGDERSAADADAPVLLISQFTLYADVKKGRRPSWNGAAPGPIAEPLVHAVARGLRTRLSHVDEGVFGAMMRVSLVNDGPVTILLDSRT